MRATAVALFLWELPQNLLGLATLAAQLAARNVKCVERERGRFVVELRGVGGLSLGSFVFHSAVDSPYIPVGRENRAHELGHAVQSRWLGPLYLPLVGAPSVARVVYARAYYRMHGARWPHYYDGWPERAADVLGGVDRTLRPAP